MWKQVHRVHNVPRTTQLISDEIDSVWLVWFQSSCFLPEGLLVSCGSWKRFKAEAKDRWGTHWLHIWITLSPQTTEKCLQSPWKEATALRWKGACWWIRYKGHSKWSDTAFTWLISSGATGQSRRKAGKSVYLPGALRLDSIQVWRPV